MVKDRWQQQYEKEVVKRERDLVACFAVSLAS